ncbi:MAG: hypothetical protein BMS9Abin09_0034 [Gammaproteobacteria bacterium]|nr:MAG: hypothetical protein BMS9Abin09_0034 [Gammaproteobacteria bacterium]
MHIYSSRPVEERNLVMGCRLAYAILLLVDQQCRNRYMQRFGQALKIIQPDVPLAAFNSTYIGAVQSALFGKLLLAPAVQAAKIAHIV